MSEIQTVQTKHDLNDGEFLSLPPLYCHQWQAKFCIRAVKGGDRSGHAYLFSPHSRLICEGQLLGARTPEPKGRHCSDRAPERGSLGLASDLKEAVKKFKLNALLANPISLLPLKPSTLLSVLQ